MQLSRMTVSCCAIFLLIRNTLTVMRMSSARENQLLYEEEGSSFRWVVQIMRRENGSR
jgi:hypothetical protein